MTLYAIDIAVCWDDRSWSVLDTMEIKAKSEKTACKKAMKIAQNMEHLWAPEDSISIKKPIHFFVIDSSLAD